MGKRNIIVAMANNGCIGKDNDLPWRLPADLKFFKKTTLGHTILMGRKTFESIGSKPLPGRKNVVITRDVNFKSEGVDIYHSIDKALEQLIDEDIFIIGGAQIYEQTLQLTDFLYITRVNTTVDGDAYFPEISSSNWELIQEEMHPIDEKNHLEMRFQVYQKR
jgi:dihydrofolate reductase